MQFQLKCVKQFFLIELKNCYTENAISQTIIANVALSIISTKMKVPMFFSVWLSSGFFVKNSSLIDSTEQTNNTVSCICYDCKTWLIQNLISVEKFVLMYFYVSLLIQKQILSDVSWLEQVQKHAYVINEWSTN